MYQPRAYIINIGNELLIGRIINSNGAWLASQLTLRGVIVERIVVVPDNLNSIVEEVRRARNRSDIVITTGGLGPTDDDITLEAVAAAFNLPLVVNKEAYEMVKKVYESKGYVLTKERIKMAYLPLGATPIPNPIGSAPGSYLVINGVHIISLPGVPSEMMAMFDYVIEKLRPILPDLCVKEESMTIKGIPESSLAPLLRKASKECIDCYVKSHPMGIEVEGPVIEVKVLSSASSCEEAARKAKSVLNKLSVLIEESKHV